MSNENVTYIEVHDDGTVEVMPDAYITPENIGQMKFFFEKPRDITNSLKNNNKLNNPSVNDTTEHRTAYGAGECRYPDGKTTSQIVLTDVIFQYREGVDKKEDTNYGKTYICIGIPMKYGTKICMDADTNSTVKLQIKDKYEVIEGHYWMDCNLDKLPASSTYVINSEGATIPTTLQKMLKTAKKCFVGDMFTTISASATDDEVGKKMNLDRTYNLAMKPTEIFLRTVSPLTGPTLKELKKRAKEETNKSDRFVASDELVALALKSVTI